MNCSRSTAGRDVAVLGAGPAGIAVAVGLARLGYRVDLYGARTRMATEGVSQRVISQLAGHNLRSAARSIGVYAPRHRDWGGEVTDNSGEYLLDRTQFDLALREDAVAAGVKVVISPVIDRVPQGQRWMIATRTGASNYAAVVDARGRRFRGSVIRGPALIAVAQRFALERASVPETGVVSMASAWCWYAVDGQGHINVQIVTSPVHTRSRAALHLWMSTRGTLPERLAERLARDNPRGHVSARAATACLRWPAERPGLLYAGDAAMAHDPLSGHGIYEALRAAKTNVAAIHTYLQSGQWTSVQQFLNERATELWQRKLVAALAFYNAVSQTVERGFWRATAESYARLIAPTVKRPKGTLRIECRPVLNVDNIQLRRVLVTPDLPRGVWSLDSIEVASLLDYLTEGSKDASEVSARFDRPYKSVMNALNWLCSEGAAKRCGASGFRATESVLSPERR